MNPVFVIAENIYSPIAKTAAENFERLSKNISGIQLHNDPAFSPEPFYASLFNKNEAILNQGTTGNTYTKFETLLIASVSDALSLTNINAKDKRTIMVVSSTKGNVSLMESQPVDEALKKRMSLPVSAKLIADYFQCSNTPVIISHACISGLVALITGMRLLQSGAYDNAIITGADIITKFILSGFQSFHAVSNEPCKPFDANRNGITLGEGAATIILSVNKPHGDAIVLSGGSVSNDANHISGPSRTGEELYQAIEAAMKEAGIDKQQVDMISAHGTATIYNDEMESKAITLAGLQTVPLNSLKGFFGHTLGAAGLIETAVSVYSLKQNTMIGTPGFSTPGTSKMVNINAGLQTGEYHCCLKTASGFGGCNAAIVLQKSK